MNWVLFWLTLHIIAAVIAFGPTFVFPVIGVMVGRYPQHGHFAAMLNHRIERFLVIPFAGSMLVSGVGLLIAADISLFKTTYLLIAVILYLIAIGTAIVVLVPETHRMIQLTETPPTGEAALELQRLVNRARGIGGALTVIFLVIITLMIVQPGGLVFGPIFG
jgi:hypothetical protein